MAMPGIQTRSILIGLALAAAIVASISSARSQSRLGAPVATPAAAPSVAERPAAKPNMPSPETLLALVRTHVLALDHALRTGNFYVLHALSGPFLQSRLTPEQLANAFKPLKAERLDLAAAAIVTPTLASAPAFTKNSMLWMKGEFPARPKTIRFEMMFEVVNAEWRLAGLDIGTGATPVAEEKKAAPAVAAKK